MDPQATLILIREAIDGKNLDEVRYLLDCFREWRDKGGFQPKQPE